MANSVEPMMDTGDHPDFSKNHGDKTSEESDDVVGEEGGINNQTINSIIIKPQLI